MTRRDKRLLEDISCGPILLSVLHHDHFLKTDGNLTSSSCFNRRMRKLRDNGLILIHEQEIGSSVQRYATLTQLGANQVALLGHERDHIRMTNPRPLHLIHELYLSTLIRHIRKEASSTNTYAMEYIYDDVVMKSLLKQNGTIPKNIFYPDDVVK